MILKQAIAKVTLTLGVIMIPTAGVAAENVAVIVHVSNAAQDLDSKHLGRLFLKKMPSWKKGPKVRPIDRADADDVRRTFLHEVLQLSTEEVERYWIEQQYAKAVNPPRKASSDSDIIKFVGAFKGAIGFIDAASLSEKDSEKVRVILELPIKQE